MRFLFSVVLLWAAIPSPVIGRRSRRRRPADLSAKSPNVAAEYPDFGDLTLCVGRNGFMEWSAEVEGGVYYVHFLYCSGEPRPCRMSINGRMLDGEVLGEVTGGFMPANLAWKTLGPIDLARRQQPHPDRDVRLHAPSERALRFPVPQAAGPIRFPAEGGGVRRTCERS